MFWLHSEDAPGWGDLARFAAARSLTARSLTLAFQTTTLSLRQATPFASEPGPRGDKSRRSKPGTGLPPGFVGWACTGLAAPIIMLSPSFLFLPEAQTRRTNTGGRPAPRLLHIACRHADRPLARTLERRVPDDLDGFHAVWISVDGTDPSAVVIISMRPQTRFRVGPKPWRSAQPTQGLRLLSDSACLGHGQ